MESRNIKDYFTPTSWEILSNYEKRRYGHLMENYEMMKSVGIMTKLPQFMTYNNNCQKQNRNKNCDSKAVAPVKRSQQTKVKLFGVTAQPKRRRIEEVDQPSTSTKTPEPLVATKAREIPMLNLDTTQSLRHKKAKQFAEIMLKSCYNLKKSLQDLSAFSESDLSMDEEILKVERKSRYPKRNIQKKSYKEEEVSSDDEFLHCDECENDYKGVCPDHGPMILICDKKVAKDDPDAAKNTLPDLMSLGRSTIKKAGLGVWTDVPLPKGLLFGPYKGVKVPKKKEESGYAWQIRKANWLGHLVEAKDPSKSNWMRYVNCSGEEERQNMVALQFKGDIYYKTYKSVLAHCELLTYYGDSYAKHLGIDTRRRKDIVAPKEVTGHACDFCGSLFSSSSALEAHRKTHPHMKPDLKFKCTHCAFSSNKDTNLQHHLLTHTGELPHKCPHCKKGFARKSNLTRHLRVHTEEKPFSCAQCGKEFNQLGNLQRHLRSHVGERRHRCSTCGKDFGRSCHLKRHERTHTLQKPYRCPHCDFRAAQAGNLRQHVLDVHTRELKHTCSHCDYRATRAGHLRDHIVRVHMRDYKQKCTECGKGFLRPNQLKKHEEKKHSKKAKEQEK